MSPSSVHASPCHRFELRFDSLFKPGRGYSFPCDSRGCVDLDALSDGERHSYLYARSIVGCELTAPALLRRAG